MYTASLKIYFHSLKKPTAKHNTTPAPVKKKAIMEAPEPKNANPTSKLYSISSDLIGFGPVTWIVAKLQNPDVFIGPASGRCLSKTNFTEFSTD